MLSIRCVFKAKCGGKVKHKKNELQKGYTDSTAVRMTKISIIKHGCKTDESCILLFIISLNES